MNVRNSMIAAIIVTGVASSAVFADDVSTVINYEPAAVNSNVTPAFDPIVNIQDVVDAAREAQSNSISADADYDSEPTAQVITPWTQNRIL